MKPAHFFLAILAIGAPLLAGPITAYSQTTLVSSATDPDLINPWGVSFSATSPFWVSDNGTGRATLYNSSGVKQGLVVSMPAGSADITGQVFNGTASFNNDLFLFASEDGTIAGWRGALGTTAEQLFAVGGADYKGLSITSTKDTLFAANFGAGTIDQFNSAGLIGSFTDPTMPAGFAPFNVQNIGGVFYVTFAKKGAGGDDVPGAGNGYVDIFDPVSHTFTRLISQGTLDSPWGLAVAPASFGPAGGDLLVGNFGDGTINAFTLGGTFIGTLADSSSSILTNDGLWGLTFGNGGNGGNVASLYLTAGGAGETTGLFARIDAVPEPATAGLIAVGLVVLAMGRRARARMSL